MDIPSLIRKKQCKKTQNRLCFKRKMNKNLFGLTQTSISLIEFRFDVSFNEQ